MSAKQICFTQKWSELSEENKYLESEELVLRNTFINAKTTPAIQYEHEHEEPLFRKQNTLKWADIDADLPLTIQNDEKTEKVLPHA